MYEMKRKSIVFSGIVIIAILFISFLGGCTSQDSGKLSVVTSTSLLAQIVERVGGDRVEVVNIIPPAQCPGHFDVKPGDVQMLADTDLFLFHGWQGEQFTDDLIASADNPDLNSVIINIPGNWMTPPVQVQAIDLITGILSEADAEDSAAFQQAASEMKASVQSQGEAAKQRLARAGVSSVNVLCADQQAGFVQWAGFNVVATFGRPEDLTPQIVKELVDKGREGQVSLVIDNVQSGQDAGAGIAEELGSARAILSNFPGSYEGTETWEKTLDYNVTLLLDAIAK
jgi:zinc transport system substrate-binding protein